MVLPRGPSANPEISWYSLGYLPPVLLPANEGALGTTGCPPCLRDGGGGDAKGTIGRARAHIAKKDGPPQECWSSRPHAHLTDEESKAPERVPKSAKQSAAEEEVLLRRVLLGLLVS